MEAVFGLMVLLLGVCHGVDTHCDGRQDGAQCFGALGASVTLRLMDDASEIFIFQWIKGSSVLLNWRNNKIRNQLQDRFQFIPNNGTFRINKLNRSDSGEYVFVSFNKEGLIAAPARSLQLSVEAPVSSVLLRSECLTRGQTRLSCSSGGGDSPQYSWTLDGRPLTDAELVSGNNETINMITVKENVSGYVVCTVSNHVSRVCGFVDIQCELFNETLKTEQLFGDSHTECVKPTAAPSTTTTVGKETVSNTPCTNHTTFNQTAGSDGQWFMKNLPVMIGVLSALVIFLVLGVTVIHLQRRKKNNSPKAEEDDQELTYADVKIVQRQARQGKQVNQRAEAEVEYGQVRFSQRPQQTTADECVYSMVRKAR